MSKSSYSELRTWMEWLLTWDAVHHWPRLWLSTSACAPTTPGLLCGRSSQLLTHGACPHAVITAANIIMSYYSSWLVSCNVIQGVFNPTSFQTQKVVVKEKFIKWHPYFYHIIIHQLVYIVVIFIVYRRYILHYTHQNGFEQQ